MANTIWDILGISPTCDKKEIKRAYAVKSSSCHPEEFPREFDQLHKAYSAALKAAASGGSVTDAPGPSPCPDKADTTEKTDTQETPQPLSIYQLVEKGMEREMQTACSRLMGSLETLHASFPNSVNTDPEAFAKALIRMEEWFKSPRFQLAGHTPDFLRQLDRWLSANREEVNRAEAVSLYVVFGFKYYDSTSYPSIPCIDNVHWEVMFHAPRYEKELVLLAGMPPLTKTDGTLKQTVSKSRPRISGAVCLILLILLIMIGTVAIISLTSGRSPLSKNQWGAIENEYLENMESHTLPAPGTGAEAPWS